MGSFISSQYQLVLVDWARSLIVNLGDLAALDRYLGNEEDP
jgi:hypothetical protein